MAIKNKMSNKLYINYIKLFKNKVNSYKKHAILLA